jgi:hypothetical protein
MPVLMLSVVSNFLVIDTAGEWHLSPAKLAKNE